MDSKEQSLIHPWKDEIFQILKNGGVSQVTYVPDAGHAQVINHAWADKVCEPSLLRQKKRV
jgi:hypothetical protein